MIIAQQLREKNRAEYLLYMWQVEDIVRLHGCDIDKLDEGYLARFDVDADTRREMRQWYADLCDMMRSEGKVQQGHLQVNENVIVGLSDLNTQLLASEKFPYYKQMYYKVLPYIVELRAKRQTGPEESMADPEFSLLFEFLYGIVLLRLQRKDITPETERAAKDITALLGQLSDYWKADKAGQLDLGDAR